MFSPETIVAWMETNVKGMRRSRMKTLAAIVPGAMAMCGLGILALGRAMLTRTTAKHNIKRVNRFLGNAALEGEALAAGLFAAFAPRQGRVLVLADWTDVANGKLLVFALPRSGRALPFFAKAIAKDAGEGEMVQAEREALDALARICRGRSDVTIVAVADRGFGNQRWITGVQAQGWHYVQRLSRVFFVDVEGYIGTLKEHRLRKGAKPRDWGYGVFGEAEEIEGRLITVYDKQAKQPWYLVTDLEDASAYEVVGMYRRRMWIEALFRDKKNRDWGMSLDAVVFKDYRRYERLFYVVALAFIFLSALGAFAEAKGFDIRFKANTRARRVINLIRLGFHYLRRHRCSLDRALSALAELPA